MCSYKRFHNIPAIISSLDSQTVAHRIHLHIINNNPEYILEFDKIKSQKIALTIIHKNNNNFGFERFLYTGQLKKTIPTLNYIIFIDDDQYFDTDHIEKLYRLRKSKTYLSWFGKVFDAKNPVYWQIIYNKLRYGDPSIQQIEYFDYGGTGFSIIDVNIFNDNSLIWKPFKEIISVYKKIEDLWLSYVCAEYGWKTTRSFLPPNIFDDENTKKVSLCSMLKYEKQEMLECLVLKHKWKLINGKY